MIISALSFLALLTSTIRASAALFPRHIGPPSCRFIGPEVSYSSGITSHGAVSWYANAIYTSFRSLSRTFRIAKGDPSHY